jgi:hypothetical protein
MLTLECLDLEWETLVALWWAVTSLLPMTFLLIAQSLLPNKEAQALSPTLCHLNQLAVRSFVLYHLRSRLLVQGIESGFPSIYGYGYFYRQCKRSDTFKLILIRSLLATKIQIMISGEFSSWVFLPVLGLLSLKQNKVALLLVQPLDLNQQSSSDLSMLLLPTATTPPFRLDMATAWLPNSLHS